MTQVIHTPEGEIICVLVKGSNSFEDGTKKFFTPFYLPLQFGWLNFNKGDGVKAHYHQDLKREIRGTSEVLYCEFGLFEMTLYLKDGKPFGTYTVSQGDVVSLFNGFGHSFNFLQKTKLLEIKQGPYWVGGEDKVFYDN